MGFKVNWESFSFSVTDDAVDAESQRMAKRFMGMMVAIFVGIVVIEFIALIVVMRFLSPKPKPGVTRTLIVLGSGGHTAEMLKLVESLDKKHYTPRMYVVADTDPMSGHKAEEYEKSLMSKADKAKYLAAKASKAASQPQDPMEEAFKEPEGPAAEEAEFQLHEIPRSREVGQSYFTSVWTTLTALGSSFVLAFKTSPQLVLVNGPGTCIPVCIATVLYRLMAGGKCKIVYVESIARTRKLSLSGKILYNLRLADLLLVQWQELADKLPRATFAGRLY